MKDIQSIIIKGAALCVLFIVGAGGVFFLRHHESEAMSPQAAEGEFQRLHHQFTGQRPLVDMNERRPQTDANANPLSPAATLHSFHTVIFDTRGTDRVVRMSFPYRLLRCFGGDVHFRWLGQLTFVDDTEFDPEPIQLFLNDVERHGPGLIVGYRHPSGGWFISWVD